MHIKEKPALILLIVFFTLAAYYVSLDNAFIWDDRPLIKENQAIRKLDFKSLASYFTDRNTASMRQAFCRQIWRPLTVTSFAVDYSLCKLDVRWYHAENTLLHASNAVLVFLMTEFITGDSLAALLAGIVFSIHPVQTEAVTLISGRANVLFLLFFLISFIFHIRNRVFKKSYLDYGLCLAFFVFGLLSKEMAITLPLACILYDAHFFNQKPFRYYMSYYLPFFLTAFFYLVARSFVLGCIAQREMLAQGNISAVAATMMKAVAGYVQLIFVPVNLRTEYLMNISGSLLDKDVIQAVVLLLCIAAACIILRRQKTVSFYILWFFVTLLPVCNIIPINAVMNQRFLYLPSVAFSGLFGILISGLLKRAGSKLVKTALLILLALVLLFYLCATISRNMEMRDEMTFCIKELERSPGNALFHYNLGNEYVKKGRAYYVAAILEYKKCISLKPDYQWAYINLADVYLNLGLCDKAIENYEKAVSLPEHDEYTLVAYDHLAKAYDIMGQGDKAKAARLQSLDLENRR